jgi:hypothetical protein
MRNFVYKAIIVTIAFILIFEFTVGRKINEFSQVGEKILTKEGRKDMIVNVKNEMRKAINKENYLTNEERVLINEFLLKIKNELNSVKEN